MQSKPTEKNRALELRSQGYSLHEISTKLGVSKGSVSVWVRDILLSDTAKKRILQKREDGTLKARQLKLASTAGEIKKASIFGLNVVANVPATKDISRLHAALLYWCEGEKSKNDKSLTFTNSDPLLMSAFLKELRNGYEINEAKFRVCVHLHSYHNTKKQLLFWSQITTIPLTQFIKPYQKANSGKNIRLGYAGCASVRYHDVRIARRVMGTARAFLNK